jgi:hypothetical protein
MPGRLLVNIAEYIFNIRLRIFLFLKRVFQYTEGVLHLLFFRKKERKKAAGFKMVM